MMVWLSPIEVKAVVAKGPPIGTTVVEVEVGTEEEDGRKIVVGRMTIIGRTRDGILVVGVVVAVDGSAITRHRTRAKANPTTREKATVTKVVARVSGHPEDKGA